MITIHAFSAYLTSVDPDTGDRDVESTVTYAWHVDEIEPRAEARIIEEYNEHVDSPDTAVTQYLITVPWKVENEFNSGNEEALENFVDHLEWALDWRDRSVEVVKRNAVAEQIAGPVDALARR